MRTQNSFLSAVLILGIGALDFGFVRRPPFGGTLSAQTPGEWTWMKGDSIINVNGVYGTQGIADPSNSPGGRYIAASWTDTSGNFWILGGWGYAASGATGALNDLWKYDIVTNEWVWIKGDSTMNVNGVYGTQGVTNPSNMPGSRRYTAAWTDASGIFWLFGGRGYPASGGWESLNDLWRYNPATNEWTWMKGDSTISVPGVYGIQGIAAQANKPGSRVYSATWRDTAGNLWLWGGWGYTANGSVGWLNDLWKYDPATNEWAWMKGDSTISVTGVYGVQGNAAPANKPGGRQLAVSWRDISGNFWLFGGFGYPDSGAPGDLNDLWKYNIATNEWTWMKGDNIANINGVYGIQCTADPSNKPGGRQLTAIWTDMSGNLCLFGGLGYPASGVKGNLNDLWKYNTATNEWTWIKGDSIINVNGVYGTMLVSSAANKPGGRYITGSWTDASGNFWLLGAGGYPASGGIGYLNDLWKLVPSCNILSSTATLSNPLCNGQCNGTATANPGGGTTPYTYFWNNNQTSQTITGLCAGTYTATVTDALSSTVTVTVTIMQPTLLTATATATNSACNSNNGSATINAGGGTTGYSYSWSVTPVQTAQIATGLESGNYTVTVTDANNCTTTQTVTVVSSGSVITTNQSASICSGSTYTLPGGTVVSTGGTYNDTLTSVNGCDSIITTTLTVSPNPTVAAFSNATITQGQVITLTASGGGIYSWSNGSSGYSITVDPLVTTIYCVTVTDSNNCTDTACVTVKIEPIDCSNLDALYLPNAFSPNNDGENDFLQVYYGNMACIKTFKLIIYNRWGEKVFETTNPANQWDGHYKGRLMNTAVFIYYLNAALTTNYKVIQKGNISLIR